MLHRVKPPQYAHLLMQVIEFEKALLRWICTPPIAFTLDGVKAALNNDEQAEWLWERIERGGKKTAFGNAIQKAVEYIQQEPVAGMRVLQCAQNDLDFHQHFTDTGFSFHERRLPAGAINSHDLDAFNPMLVGLYENIFGGTGGFPPTIHQDASIGKLTRAMWNEDFWIMNSSIGFCPACNGQRPSNISRNRSNTAKAPDNTDDDDVFRSSDVDHFFPKEKYPFLSIHPDNLIPTCSECNTKAHRSYDPLDDHSTETLLDTFHSYYCPAIEHIKLYIDSQTGKGVKAVIREQDGTRSKRINNLVRVFDLETRWADWFEAFINSRIPVIRAHSITTQEGVREFLQNDFDNNQDPYRLTQDKCFVYASFLQYVLENQQEFDSLCASFGL